jgi:hypothetical protein
MPSLQEFPAGTTLKSVARRVAPACRCIDACRTRYLRVRCSQIGTGLPLVENHSNSTSISQGRPTP